MVNCLERTQKSKASPDVIQDQNFDDFALKLHVSPDVHEEDMIYKFLVEHPDIGPGKAAEYYFTDGQKSAQALRGLVERDTAINPEEPWTMLEFASGYGCVSRHLAKAAPKAEVTACDIHQQAIDFIQDRLSVNAVISVPDPDEFWLGREYDVVFALSFFSHMPIRSWGRWLKALFRHVRPGGSLIFTTHGYVTLEKLYKNSVALDNDGFWFIASSEQLDIETAEYGTTITSTEFVTRQIFSQLHAPTSLISPGFWWEHQDVYVVTKI
jgi:SAM-dependent methyltransferase